jgi:hypothetical protein
MTNTSFKRLEETMPKHIIRKLPLTVRFSSRKIRLLVVLFSLVAVSLLWPNHALAQQGTLTDDAYTSSNKANKNFGSDQSVQITGTTDRGFVKFKLTSSLPPNTIGGHVGKATLKFFVGNVTTPGTLEIRPVIAAWAEGNITDASAPALSTPIAVVAINATDNGKWITIDVTQVVKDWLDGLLPNNGLAIVPTDPVNIKLDSKENGVTSHEPRLEIVLSHAAMADQATTADSANTITGVVAASNGGTGLTTSGTAGNFLRSNGTTWTSMPLSSSDVPDLGSLYIKNATTTQPASNFNISGDGKAGGTLTGNAVNTDTQYNIAGFRILHNTGASNLFAGIAAGDANTGSNNAFFGFNAGRANTTGSLNAFFGQGAGQANTTGQNNAFFGSAAGTNNSTGVRNSFFGSLAGLFNTTGGFNSFFGTSSAFSNTTGVRNSFFGNQSGQANTTGSSNVLVGDNAGFNNTTGTGNTFVGQNSGASNTTESLNTFIGVLANGAPGITNATAIGANTTVNASNTMVLGTNAVTVQVPGNLNVTGSFSGSIPAGSGNYVQNTTMRQASSNFNISGDGTAGGRLSANVVNAATAYSIGGFIVFHNTGGNLSVGIAAGEANTTGGSNSFFGLNAGRVNTSGSGNAFFGTVAGQSNTDGSNDAFFGFGAGGANTTGNFNAFFGQNAGEENTTGSNNAFFGGGVGQHNTTATFNSFFGSFSGLANTTGSGNSFFGAQSGSHNTTGYSNSFLGIQAGINNITGFDNSFFGTAAGGANTTGDGNTFVGQGSGGSNTVESENTFIGYHTNGAAGISNATAIGANAAVTQSNSLVLGNNANVGVGTSSPKEKLEVQSGNILIGSPGNGIILKSPDGGTCRLLTIDNAGSLVTSPITCP